MPLAVLPSLLVQWSYCNNLPKQDTKSMKVYADKAQKIKSVYHCTYRQINDVISLLLK